MRLTLLLLFLSTQLYAQYSPMVEYILRKPSLKVEKVATKGVPMGIMFLEVDFAESSILDLRQVDSLHGLQIDGVDLVYTRFRESENFDQYGLNKKRLEILNQYFPYLVSDPLVNWRMIEQTGCDNPSDCDEYFHGFVFRYRPGRSAEQVEREIDILDEFLGEDLEDDPADRFAEGDECDRLPSFPGGDDQMYAFFREYLRYPDLARKARIEGRVYLSFELDRYGYVRNVQVHSGIGGGCDEEAVRVARMMPAWLPARKSCQDVEAKMILPVLFEAGNVKMTHERQDTGDLDWTVIGSSMKTREELKAEKELKSGNPLHISDSVVLNVFNRNTDWKNLLVVCDFTGSMYPYTAQMLLWHKNQVRMKKPSVKHFTFFNDGDGMPDEDKEIGETGGIYHESGKSYNKIKAMAYQCMRQGGGGDRPENNLEAVIAGIDACPDCEEIVLIADNMATPRDLRLMDRIHRPVRIVLAAVHGTINKEYLNLARTKNWSVHTLENDVKDLGTLKDEETIQIGKYTYQLKAGRFTPVFRLDK